MSPSLPSNAGQQEPGCNIEKRAADLTTTNTTTSDHKNLNKVVAPGIILFIDQILVAAGAWVFWLVISKLTTSSDIGIATAFYSLAMLVSTASQLGLEYPLLKRSSSDRSKILGTVIALEIVLTVVSIPVLLFVGSVMYGEESKGEYIWLTVGILVFTSLGFVSRFALLGMADAKNVLVFDMLGTGLKFAIGFTLVGQGYSGVGILASFVAYNAVILAGTLAVSKRRFPLHLGSMSYSKEILKEGLANMPSKLSKIFIMNLSVVLLSFLGAISSSDVGVFYIELMISLAAGSMAASMAYMVIPATDSKTGSDLSAGGIRIGLSLTAIIATALLVDPTFVLYFIGPNYASEGTSFLILCTSIIPAAILNSSVAKLNTSNKLRALVIIGSVQIATFLSAFFALSPTYGLTGTSFSILAAFSFAAILSLIWCHDRPYLRSIISSSSAVLVGWLVGYTLQMMSYLQTPALLISVSAAVTAAVLLATKNILPLDIRTILGARAEIKRNPRKVDGKKWNQKEQKTVLMLGNYGNFNIGDEMLLKAVIKDIRKNSGDNVTFQIPTRNSRFVDIYHKADSHLIEPVPVSSPLRMVKAFFKSDVIVVGGGGIWSGYTGPLAHFIPIVTLAGKLLGKHSEFRAIGIYSTAWVVDRFFVNLAVLLADQCSIRDEESYQLLWKINKRKARKVDDLAIQYLRQLSKEDIVKEISPHQRKLLSMRENGKFVIGISVKPVNRNDTNRKVIDEFSLAINTLNSKYPERLYFVFFPFAKTDSRVESDEEFTEMIHNHISTDYNNITVIEHSDPVSWFLAIKEYVDIFVGMRFHSIIFAHEAKKPILCIPYERKIMEFLRGKQTEDVSVMPPDSLESSKIVNFVELYLKNRMISRGMQEHE